MRFSFTDHRIQRGIIGTWGLLLLVACMSQKKHQKLSSKTITERPNLPMFELQKGFKNPPDSIQTSVYWYWISDNISKEGVIKDLQSMKRVGINRAFIGNIGLNETPYGKVKIFSGEWWDIIHAALKTATELNIEIGIFNSPGWSQSGGPWIKADQSMRYLASSEITVKGPQKLHTRLEETAADFQDVRVIAFPAPKDYHKTIAYLKPKVTVHPAVKNINNIVDNDSFTETKISATTTIDFETEKSFTVRSVTFYPADKKMTASGEIQAKENGKYETVKSFIIDRSNDALNVGFKPYAPVVVSIPSVKSNAFRLIFKNTSKEFTLKEIEISPSPKVESYAEKTLAKMYPTPLPYWKEYQWPMQPVVQEDNLLIKPSEVIDISEHMTPSGDLDWNIPPGEWVIMRAGMVPTEVTNSPASPEGTGLEVDKMNKEHVEHHFNSFLGEIIRRIPSEDRKTWKVTVQDSYETGGQNWTDDLIKKFKEYYGYDPLPYLPVMNGRVVGSPEMSDRFLWDLRRFIADKVAYEYVGGLREISHKYGLRTWLENYGHWGFPGEFLQYGGQSDEIGGEFWSEGELGDIENKAASSAAHIYGKTKVSAESFTAGGKAYARYPALMKQRGDRFFTEGINNTLLHVFISQPDDSKMPGINTWFGNEFNRLNTWFYDMDLFINYLKRCNYMLQQGNYVADVAYFIGEDAPKMTGVRDPEIPKGYSYDYINAEVIEKRAAVKDGRLVLPDGMSYRILVLPKLETMRPALLRKIKALITQGAVVLGPRPARSPSLQNYPKADEEIKGLASELWGNIDGNTVRINHFGKGMVIEGMDMQEALGYLKIAPDCKTAVSDPLLFIHRSMKEGDIYFISNQAEHTITVTPEFRVTGKTPELWDAITGSVRDLPAYTQKGGSISVPLKLEPLQSMFIVFRNTTGNSLPSETIANFPDPEEISPVTGSWVVSFDPKMRGPEKPIIFDSLVEWTRSTDESIKYYSGTAVYHNTLRTVKIRDKSRLYLDLGNLTAIAKVKINGMPAGGVWTAPYQVDITDYVKPGNNKIEISVTNNWINRLIGDLNLPEKQRKTWLSINPYAKDSTLQPSGLFGPVVLKRVKY